MFERLEGIDICAPAAVAVASLVQALKQGQVGSRDSILVNITGGGLMRLKRNHRLHYLQPDVIVHNPDVDFENVLVELDHTV